MHRTRNNRYSSANNISTPALIQNYHQLSIHRPQNAGTFGNVHMIIDRMSQVVTYLSYDARSSKHL